MGTFIVQEDIEFPRRKVGHSSELAVAKFWESVPAALAEKRGVYVFCARRARSKLVPYYVGMASKSFRQEVTTDRNMRKYETALKHERKATPVVFFITHPPTKTNMNHLREVEDFLIKSGRSVNPNIQNLRGGKVSEWEISGVTKSPGRKRTNVELAFGKAFDLELKSA